MTTDSTLNWTLELVRRPAANGGGFHTRVLSARHQPTGKKILLVLDEHDCVVRATRDESCPHELLDEVLALFPACLQGDYA